MWKPHWAIESLHVCGGSKCILRQREFSHRTAASVYLLTHSHSSSYYHALVESLPKLLFGLALLRSEPSIKVAHNSPRTLPAGLRALGLGGRDVLAPTATDNRPLLASTVIVPPPSRLVVVRALTARLRAGTIGDASGGGGGTLLVRRSLGYDSGGAARGIYNHHELQWALEQWLDREAAQDAAAGVDARAAPRAKRPLVVFEPSGTSFAETVRLWSSASLVVAPHGGGLANLMFCPPGATVVELYREGDPHNIYQQLSAMYGLRYVGCPHGPRRAGKDTGTTNFVLNLTWFFDVCLRGEASETASRGGPPCEDDPLYVDQYGWSCWSWRDYECAGYADSATTVSRCPESCANAKRRTAAAVCPPGPPPAP